ncbi:E3 ubiquitin-protein ligase TRIM35-like [Astyanax mexicanus]|uniref:E3 ubiquitin-protein ligase TRIM35-like n=1 Tax=Astyanax mexicanus TaxID=7994 RepID=UPI0020CB21EE|nr:E3 ubiquitin-protein ligase TRIM35-like [Astyanax mexicanus]
MASSLASLEKDLTCELCQDIYKDPLILLCSHSFCRNCLKQHWRERGVKECPVCRKRSSMENPPVNKALKSTCESFIQERNRNVLARSQGELCSEHSEKVTVWCLDDHKLLCSVCVTQQHQEHKFCSVSRAAYEYKDQLKTPLKFLRAKSSSFSSARMFYHTMASQLQSQTQQTEQQIRAEFEKLHLFLREEEKNRITALKEEEEGKMKMMKEKITEFDQILAETVGRISRIEDYIRSEEHFLLKNLKDAEQSAQCPAVDPQHDSAVLIDVAKHLGNLRYRVWKKMKDICLYFPVILDPNTAKSSAALCEDLSGVSLGSPVKNLPNNPERFNVYNMVLGSEGFTAGSHSWEVDVDQSEDWIIGVVKESIRRKEKCTVGPVDGFWTVSLRDGSYSWSVYARKCRRIRVEVNCDTGTVIFTNTENNQVLQIYKHRFTEKIYPVFCTISGFPIRISPYEISVKEENYKAVFQFLSVSPYPFPVMSQFPFVSVPVNVFVPVPLFSPVQSTLPFVSPVHSLFPSPVQSNVQSPFV